jgi:phosphoesterase RecJ-like protein
MNNKHIISEETIKSLKTLLSSPKKILLTTHKSPDGDAIGSSLALYHYLKAQGHNVSVSVPDDMPGFLKWMPGSENLIVFKRNPKGFVSILEDTDILFSLDYNHFKRTGDEMEKLLANSKAVKIMIDHHQQPDDYMQYRVWDVMASSTAQLVWEFIVALSGKQAVDKTIGECLYTGIMTDTGSFRFATCSSHTFRITADLLDIGVRGDLIHQYVYDQNSIDRIHLMGYALEKIVLMPEQKTAYIALSKEELKKFKYKPGDTEGLVNKVLSVVGVEVAALITEKENQVRLSLRSSGNFSVNQLSRAYFNGGGHENAAGGSLEMNFNEAIQYFKNSIKNVIQ